MLKSCHYCGRVHDEKYNCGRRPQKIKATSEADRFRWTKRWQYKRDEIRERDLNLCQVCIRHLYGADRAYNYLHLSVHHAVPISAAWDRRLDNDNLITLCDVHHEMAESGEIPYSTIKKIIDEQEEES